ncbi:hypothetical protein PInf_012529 [Phytophthora infestans]|nr:hypothetical protein PInf_012529 [Phytophthora infestans]
MDPDETIMNYWANVAMQVNSTAFWKTLSTFDVRDVTEKMLSVLLPICRSPDFDKDLFATVHEVAGVLCEWVQKCTAFARDFVLALPKQAQLEREKELLKEAEKQVVKTKVEIYNQSTSAQQAGAQRDLSEQERQRADEKLHDSTSLLQLTTPYSLTPSSLHRPLHEIFRIGESELAKMNLNGVQVDDESTLESAPHSWNRKLCTKFWSLKDDFEK